MTNTTEIYKQAVASLDDPILTRIYKISDIDFCEKMRCYLERAIPLFNTPITIRPVLESYVAPTMKEYSFEGDGVISSFEVENYFANKNSIVEGYVNGERQEGEYDEVEEKFTFKTTPTFNSKVVVKQYQPGYFALDLDMQALSILSLLTVACWSEKEENFLLDIRRLLTTSNFKLNDSSNVLRSKINWHYTMYEKASKLMNNYSWSLYIGGKR